MSEVVTTLSGLFGGLALFLFGMNSMSEALQKAAGERMKAVLGFLTKNPVMGALAGALVTAILQSSSATTVMVIGFVSAGLMGLPQAISVIFGANIGTTMTAQLIAFDIGDYIYPIIFTGFLIQFLARKENIKNVGMVLFSFGLLFEGIEIMSSVMKPLAGSTVFIDLMSKVKDIPILGIFLGLCMTLVVQSSSATIAVLQSFASQPGPDGVSSVIGLTGAIPILLGDNIGTTITALLASIGQSRNAKRTAIAHSTFNITGSVLFVFLIPWFARFVAFISPRGPEVSVISRQIANAHTIFNITMTLIWLPLLPLMVRIVRTLIPGEDAAESAVAKPVYLDRKMLAQPIPALYLVSREIERCGQNISELFRKVKDEVRGRRAVKHEEGFSYAYAGTKAVQEQIVDYLSELFASGSLSQSQSEEAAGLLTVINDMDRISDRCSDVVVAVRKAAQSGQIFSEAAAEELSQCVDAAGSMFDQSIRLLHGGSLEETREIARAKNKLRKAAKQFNKAHLQRVKSKNCDEAMTPVYTGILYNMDRIGDNCVSIAEESLDHVRLLSPEDVGITAADTARAESE